MERKFILRIDYLLLLLILVIFISYALIFILKIPPVWPDEALYADIASNILNTHHFGLTLWSGLVKGSEQAGVGYPPLYFYLLADGFKIAGFSILAQRLISIIASIFFLITYYFLGRRLSLKGIFSILPILFLILDSTFLKTALIGRPEIIVLLLGITSLSLLTYVNKVSTKKTLLLFLSGFLLGVGFLTHYTTLFFIFSTAAYLFILYRQKVIRFKDALFFLTPLATFCAGWLIYVLTHWLSFWEIIRLSLNTKSGGVHYLWSVLGYQSLSTKIIYLSYLLVTWEFIRFTLTEKKSKYFLLLLSLLAAWLFSYNYNLEFSYATITPFVYLSLVLILQNSKGLGEKLAKVPASFVLSFILATVMITLNLNTYLKSITQQRGDNYSYNLFTQRLTDLIPNHSNIYLSAIPDPYYGFKTQREDTLHQFSALPVQKEDLIKVLNNSDYIIFNSVLGPTNGDTLTNYIEKNTEHIYTVGEANQYQAEVILLKPRNQRIN